MVGSPRRGRAAGTPIPQPPNPPGYGAWGGLGCCGLLLQLLLLFLPGDGGVVNQVAGKNHQHRCQDAQGEGYPAGDSWVAIGLGLANEVVSNDSPDGG